MLSFPKNKLNKFWARESRRSQRSGLVLSVLGIFIVSLFCHQFLWNYQASRGQDRGIASTQYGQKINPQELKQPTFWAQKPSLQDELRYGFLSGKYSITWEDNVMKQMQFVGEEKSGSLANFSKTDGFFKRYGSLLHPQFYSAEEVAGQSQGHKVFSLKNQNGETIKQIQVELDPEQRLISLKSL